MKLTIEIECDNQAFVEDQEAELWRMLREVAYKTPPHGETQGPVGLLDVNGNVVGWFEMEDE